MPTMPASGSSTSPVPVSTSDTSLSATIIMASRRRKYRSVRQSLASSTAARVSWPGYCSSLLSSRSNSVKASAVAPAKPPMTSPLPSFRTFLALDLTMVCPIETWPSPPITTVPPLRTVRMVVPCQEGISLWNIRVNPSDASTCRDVRQAMQLGCPRWRIPATPDKRRATKGYCQETAMRKAAVKRKTKETEVEVEVDLDGTGRSSVTTGIGFLDHMLDLLARHSRIDITVKAKGDLHIDHHHTTEDVGIALGQAVKQALGDMKGITRYADVYVPMDEALTRVALDISGRPFLVFKAEFVRDKVGSFDTELVQEWFQAFAMNSGITLHAETLYGTNDHHIAESCFKALARALRAAVAIDPRAKDEVPSTKGSLGG